MSTKISKKFYFYIGTTAELIKLCPVIREFEKRKVNFKIIASNQNDLHFNELKHIINKKSEDYRSLMKQTGRPKNIYLSFVFWTVKTFGNYLLYFRNEFKNEDRKKVYLIVHGDTVSSAIGSLLAKINKLRLVHIESGLRSFNFLEPFPEEISRYLVSRLADMHYCPNEWSLNNLTNVGGIKVNTYGNTVGESVNLVLNDRQKPNIGLKKGDKYFILVLHRQEHTLFNRKKTKDLINFILRETKRDLRCVFVMHKLTKDYLKSQGIYSKIKRKPRMILPPRLPYPVFIKLMHGAEFIATDGGSNQEEAYFLGLPCLLLRKRTERIEGLKDNVCLSKLNKNKIREFINNYKTYVRKPVKLRKKYPSLLIVNHLLK